MGGHEERQRAAGDATHHLYRKENSHGHPSWFPGETGRSDEDGWARVAVSVGPRAEWNGQKPGVDVKEGQTFGVKSPPGEAD